MPRIKPRYHGERASSFFRLRTRTNLAALLFSSKIKIKILTNGECYYYFYQKPKKGGGYRQIDAPRNDLKEVQSRITKLLQKITPPDYLFAPVAGRSYVDNAARHRGARSIRLLDIEDFFPSCTANRVIWYFSKRLECSPDVAAILRGIVSHQSALPQGSPCSPILAYLCYVDMWEEIQSLVENSKCLLSVYADDLTISGDTIPEALIWEIKKILYRFGHRYSVSKERSRRDKPTEITGVVLQRDRLLLPNRQHKKILDLRKMHKVTASQRQKDEIKLKIRGHQAQARQVQVQNNG